MIHRLFDVNSEAANIITLNIDLSDPFEDFRHVIADYYRTRRFKLNIVKYLSRSVS